MFAVLVLTGAESSCQQRAESNSSVRSESRVQSRAENRAESSAESDSGSSKSGVRYSVTSDARLESVTFVDRRGNKTTRTLVGRSWEGTGPSSHGTVMVSATTGPGGTMVKCSVSVNGKVVQRASAVGGSSTVVCSATY